jgi:hypothetical protein
MDARTKPSCVHEPSLSSGDIVFSSSLSLLPPLPPLSPPPLWVSLGDELATRAGSPWTFSSSPLSGWDSVLSQDPRQDAVPADWYTLAFTGDKREAKQSTGTPLLLNTTVCGDVVSTDKLKARQGYPVQNTIFTFRREVEQTLLCGTDAPVFAPTTLLPSTHPSSSTPTSTPATRTPTSTPTNRYCR